MQLMTSNWQLHGQLARTARGTERRGAVAVLLARPAAGCTPRCVAGGFAQTAPSLGSGRAETGGGWPPTAAIAPWPHPGASHLQRAALGSSQRCLPPLQTAFANPTPPTPPWPPGAAVWDAGGEPHCLPPPALPHSLSPAVLTLHPTSQATSLNTYSFKDYSDVAHFEVNYWLESC